MKTFLVSYDLDKPPQKADYHPLIARIKEWGGERILYSEWLVRANTTAAALRDDLKRFIDSSDGLVVLALTGEAAWSGGGVQLPNQSIKDLLAA
jgi:hypothetical protein